MNLVQRRGKPETVPAGRVRCADLLQSTSLREVVRTADPRNWLPRNRLAIAQPHFADPDHALPQRGRNAIEKLDPMDGLIEVFLNDHESALADRLAYLRYRLLSVGRGFQA